MPIYCKTLDDTEIFSLIPANCEKVLIMACASCMNESLAYAQKTPLFACDENGENISASYNEAKRISDTLEQENYITKIVECGFCINSSNDDKISVYERGFNPDIILALSCKAGALGVQLCTKQQVRCITVHEGYLALAYKDHNGVRVIIEEMSEEIPVSSYGETKYATIQ